MDQMIGLKTENLSIGYGKKVLLSGIELEVRPGTIVTLIGPNGSGKSTLLKTFTRQLRSLGGKVLFLEFGKDGAGKEKAESEKAGEGKAGEEKAESEKAREDKAGEQKNGAESSGRSMDDMSGGEIAKMLSMVMTERPTPELMTCREVAATGRYPYLGVMGVLGKEDWEKVDEAMKAVSADEVSDKSFYEISDGQRQRVMLARALCQEPKVLVLDEPTSYLDMRYKLDILESIRKLAKNRGIAVVMSLHELDLAMKVSDVVACVDGEHVSKIGRPEEVFAGDYVQKLYGVDEESFRPLTGATFLHGKKDAPKVFVIGGGGAGLPVYYSLQREDIPFAAGILFENDLEWDAARALASSVISVPAFTPMGEEALNAAKKVMDQCERVVCPLQTFGPLNEANQALKAYAEEKGILESN
ncbi:MAG: ATP-binding cassette domain-containing protein [Lachnospiraceae bacterium]|nr:ATP-binding cassette domain-containing protein [Lachnospiraceae bacterium]